MPNPSTIAEQEQAEIADLRRRNSELVVEISQLLHIIKEKNSIIKQLHLLLDVQ